MIKEWLRKKKKKKQRELEKKENEDEEEKKENENGEEEDLDKSPELKEFKKEEKIYILCIDKLGQEKLYNEEEKIQWKI